MNELQGASVWARFMLRTSRAVFIHSVGVLLLGVCPTAFADTQTALKNFVTVHLHEMTEAASRATVFQRNICTSARFGMILAEVIPITKTLTVDRADHITWGTWKQGVSEEGCGAKRHLNILVSVEAPDRITMSPLLPGTSLLFPPLQDNGAKQVIKTLLNLSSIKGFVCDTGYVQDTAFVALEKPDPGTKPGTNSFRETWTVAMCNNVQITVPVKFVVPNQPTTFLVDVGPLSDLRIITEFGHP